MTRVRLARANEAELCVDIERHAGKVFRGSKFDSIADAEPNDPAIPRAAQRAGLLWVATDDRDQPIGHLTAAKGVKGLLIAQIDVLPEFQSQGVGRSLIAAAEDEARRRGLPYIWLRTFRDIPWNAPFYARLGFKEIENEDFADAEVIVEADEIDNGLDPAERVTMRKTLS